MGISIRCRIYLLLFALETHAKVPGNDASNVKRRSFLTSLELVRTRDWQ
jgi:hypothetical protein